jgi:hypothetical protein
MTKEEVNALTVTADFTFTIEEASDALSFVFTDTSDSGYFDDATTIDIYFEGIDEDSDDDYTYEFIQTLTPPNGTELEVDEEDSTEFTDEVYTVHVILDAAGTYK